MRLAIYNFGLPKESFEARSFMGFNLREPLNFEAAEKAEGFIARSKYEDDAPDTWGEQMFPRFIEGSGFVSGISSFSLWRDIESLMAFSYAGVHAEALKNRHRWTRPQQWPSLVLWWVEDHSLPQWSDAVERFEHLHDHGPSAYAFTFKTPFDAEGRPYEIERERVKALSQVNVERQKTLLDAVEMMRR